MARFLVPIGVFLALVVVLAIGLTKDPRELPSPYIGKPAPEVELPSLTQPGSTVGSANYAGQVALLNVWATWCPGCRQEHDFLLQLAAEGEVPIYGLNWRDNGPDALRWLETLGDPYVDSAFDSDGRVGIDWGVYGALETFLIDQQGRVVHKHIAPLTQEIWDRDFMPIINDLKGVQ